MKNCSACRQNLPAEAFSKCKSRPDGLQPECRPCQAVRYRERCERRRGDHDTPTVAQCVRCSRWLDAAFFNRAPAKATGLHAECKDCNHDRKLIRTYGITLVQYNEMLAGQNHRCAICKEQCATGKRLAVDHDHDTGLIRGLLCQECNLMLGKGREDPYLLRAGADYLEEASRPTGIQLK